jgi:hypothetical protein
VAVELALERSESIADHVGLWGAMVCQWAREIGAEPRFLSPALAQAFLQTEQPTLTPDLPRDISCFRLLLPKGTLYGEEGPEIRSVVVAEMRAMEGWLPENFELAGGGLACIGLGEDGSTYLASNVLDPSTKAQQPAHTDFSPRLWDWDTDGVKGTASRIEQLCVHALLAQLYAKHLVAEGVGLPPFRGQVAKGHAMTIRLSTDDQPHQDQTPVHGAAEAGGRCPLHPGGSLLQCGGPAPWPALQQPGPLGSPGPYRQRPGWSQGPRHPDQRRAH